MAQSVIGVRTALYAACQTLFAADDVLVSYGDPGNYQPDVLVAVMQSRGGITSPVMTPRRPREKALETDVQISVYQAGGEEAQIAADTRAWALADQLEAFFQTDPNEKLGGACRWCFVTNVQHDPSIAWEDAGDGLPPVPAGRVADIVCTTTAFVRS